MITLKALYNACKLKNFPFAIYQLPGKLEYQFVIQLSEANYIDRNKDFTKKQGFIFAPFEIDNNHPAFHILPDITGMEHELNAEHLNTVLRAKNSTYYPNKLDNTHSATQEEYLANVLNLQNKIELGIFNKAVLSRTIIENLTIDPTDIFLKMCRKYHYSFISMVDIPGIGCWIGASPELLFQRIDHNVTLVSLAGTQAYNSDSNLEIKWDNKDIIEQQIVTDYLKGYMNHFNITNYQQYGPQTVQAGVVLHLKTTFSFSENEIQGNVGNFIYSIHPTPAIWGDPKTKNLEYINELEGYNREYYSGFLGPILDNGEMHLYVNLRTMKVLENKYILFVGSGITKDSDPLKEWNETSIKAMTLQSIIHQS